MSRDPTQDPLPSVLLFSPPFSFGFALPQPEEMSLLVRRIGDFVSDIYWDLLGWVDFSGLWEKNEAALGWVVAVYLNVSHLSLFVMKEDSKHSEEDSERSLVPLVKHLDPQCLAPLTGLTFLTLNVCLAPFSLSSVSLCPSLGLQPWISSPWIFQFGWILVLVSFANLGNLLYLSSKPYQLLSQNRLVTPSVPRSSYPPPPHPYLTRFLRIPIPIRNDRRPTRDSIHSKPPFRHCFPSFSDSLGSGSPQ